MAALTQDQVIELAANRLFPLGPPPKADKIYQTLDDALNNVALQRLADYVADDDDLRRYLRQQYAVTLGTVGNGAGMFNLTGNDNNANSLDQALLESIYGKGHETRMAGATNELNWVPNRSDLNFPIPIPNEFYYNIGPDKVLEVVSWKGVLVPGTPGPIVTFYANYIPTVAQVSTVKLQGRLVDILVDTIKNPDAFPKGERSNEQAQQPALVQGAVP